MKPVYVCRNPHEKAMQRALIQYRNPKNYDLVYEALKQAHREDLIGFDKKCLIRPRKTAAEKRTAGKNTAVGNAAGNKATGKKVTGSKITGNKATGNKAARPRKKTIRNTHQKKGKG